MSPHQVFPLSGMNVAFRSAALPALYFPRMGSGSPYSRFDDIWCGLMLQRICAATGDLITVGEPWVRHDRASDVRENLRKEAPGAAVNQRYWRTVLGVAPRGRGPRRVRPLGRAGPGRPRRALPGGLGARPGRLDPAVRRGRSQSRARERRAPGTRARRPAAELRVGRPPARRAPVVTITGGSGFVGQLLRAGLSERGYSVRVFDRHRGPLVDLLTRRWFGLRPRALPLAHAIRRVQPGS
jgi:hypothetical protein